MNLSADRAAADRLLPTGRRLPSLDALGRLAANLVGTRSSQISLLTDVQTVTGGSALPPGAVGGQGPLSESLCTVTAGSRAPLVVTDARADPRVRHLPPVVGGLVGSFLGVPLVVEGSLVVGALCVFDPAPRAWTPDHITLLEELAAWAVAELENGALVRAADRDKTRWELATEAAGIGSFDWDLPSGELSWDPRLMELFEYGADQFAGTIEAFCDRVHPGDLPRVTAEVDHAIATIGTFESEYRLALPSGTTRWVRARGRVLAGEDGAAVRMIGAALDTTGERDGEARVVHILESMSAGFVTVDLDWRLIYVNAEAERIVQMSRKELLGRTCWELLPSAVGTAFEETVRRAAVSGEPETLEAYYPPPLDAWYDIRISPASDGVSFSFVDVSERRRAQQLVQLSTTVAERLASSPDAEAAVGELSRLVVPGLADWAIVSLVDPDGTVRDTGSWHADAEQRARVERYAAVRLRPENGQGAVTEALRTRAPVVIDHGGTGRALARLRSPEAIEAMTALAPESVAVLPLDANGRMQGVLTLYRGAPRAPLTPEELAVAVSLADRAALALANARLHADERAIAARLQAANRRLREVAEHQHTVAQALQEAMLTRLPEPDHLHIVARYLTASLGEQVGGDWYDAVVLPSGATTLVIGDVVGHDIGAAALMGQLRNMLRTLAWDRDEPPSATVARLDRAMRDLRLETFATLLVLRIEQDEQDLQDGTRTLRWTSAGHPAPMLITPEGETRLLAESSDVLLGIAPESHRYDHVVRASPESTLVLYTDGLVETRSQDVLCGQRRLGEVLRTHRALALPEMLDAVVADMVGDAPDDDVAVLAVRLHDEAHPRPAEAGPAHL